MELHASRFALLEEEMRESAGIDLSDSVVFADDFEIRAFTSGEPGWSFAIVELVFTRDFGTARIMS